MFLEEMGKKWPISLSFSNTELTWLEKASFSDSSTVWMTPWVNWLATYIFCELIFILKIYLDFKIKVKILIQIMLVNNCKSSAF